MQLTRQEETQSRMEARLVNMKMCFLSRRKKEGVFVVQDNSDSVFWGPGNLVKMDRSSTRPSNDVGTSPGIVVELRVGVGALWGSLLEYTRTQVQVVGHSREGGVENVVFVDVGKS